MSEAPAARSTTEDVFARLREQILTGVLAPGEQHSIYRLSDALGVSRTPVREAVLRLADLGLVTIERNRGVTVRGVQAEDVRDVFELRLLLEVPAAAGAATHADDALRARLVAALDAMRQAARIGDEVSFTGHDRDLHAVLGEALGNRRLSQEVDRLRDSIQVRGVSTIDRTRTMSDIAEEHAPIVAAVVGGDALAAAAAMRTHLEHTAALLLGDVDLRPWTRSRTWRDGGPGIE
ncbi:GntR family transcriptional regulator [Aeromicrobium sp. CF3.5]|uniref:GntR family transcriptional regulator n=1 Tax=Aeromicrobium sp. CF3.5 TaxID=3373078 RepID=UPI003EE71814